MSLRSAIVLALALSALSCARGGDPSASPLAEDRFVRLYADLLIAREEAPLRGMPTGDTSLQDSVCGAYGVTGADVDRALERYKADLGSWKAFHAKVMRRLEELQRGTSPVPATPGRP